MMWWSESFIVILPFREIGLAIFALLIIFSFLVLCRSILLLAGLAASGYLAGGCWGQGLSAVEALLGFGDAGLDPVGDELVVGADGGARLGVLQAPYGSCPTCELDGDTDGDLLEDWSVCVASYAVIASIVPIADIAGNAGISGLAGGECCGVWAGGFWDGDCSSAGLRFHLATSASWLVAATATTSRSGRGWSIMVEPQPRRRRTMPWVR